MGITDRFRGGSFGKSKTSEGTKAENDGKKNAEGECSHSLVPQMVVTSSEGVVEVVTIDDVDTGHLNDKGPQNGHDLLPTADQAESGQISEQRPVLVCAEEVLEEVEVPCSVQGGQSEPCQSAVNRPLIIEKTENVNSAVTEDLYEEIRPPNERVAAQNGYSTSVEVQHEVIKDEKEHEGLFAKTKAFLKHDGKSRFSLPKFGFGSSKESKKLEPSIEKEDKSKIQEYDLEAAAASCSKDQEMPVESYKPLNDDGLREVPLNDSPEAPIKPVKAPEEEPKLNYVRSNMIHPSTICDPKKQKKKKDEKAEGKVSDSGEARVNGENRENSPDTLYDTCCIKLAILLRNKALELTTESPRPFPPKKPPKPTQESLIKARAALASKKLREYQSLEHHFGDDIPVGLDGIRFADDDTESSTDYKDLDNIGVIMNPECYGIIRNYNPDNKTDSFRAPSTCSGMTSYYTADTATLKDENSSDNTLETVSLGSYESVLCRPISLTEENLSSLPDQRTLSAMANDNKVNIHQRKDAKSPLSKKTPPPIPPKPAILLKSVKSANAPSLPESKVEDISRCVNALTLSPRPIVKSTTTNATSAGIRRRPLTIAGVKETEFQHFSRGKLRENLQKKPVLNTVLKNRDLKTIRNLPLEPTGFNTRLDLTPKPKEKEVTIAESPKPAKPVPPPRPPMPATLPHISRNKTKEPTSVTVAEGRQNKTQSKEIVSPPPRKAVLKQSISPPRPVPPAKPTTLPRISSPPPRPPPPVTRTMSSPTQSSNIFTSRSENERLLKTAAEVHVEEPKIIPDDSTCIDGNASSSTPKSTDVSYFTQETKHETVLCSTESPKVIDSQLSDIGLETTVTTVPCLEHSVDVCDRKLMIEMKNFKIEAADETKEPTRPPRIRSKRSRTVEVHSTRSEEHEIKRRSQSLSDLDIKKRVDALEVASQDRPELKVLYTVVHKIPSKDKSVVSKVENEIEDNSINSEDRSSRPLPAPPRPPRTKSHSSSRRSKSDERPGSAKAFSDDIGGITRTESLPDNVNGDLHPIQPPARRKKERLFFSLDIKEERRRKNWYHKRTFNSLRLPKTDDEPPKKPERRTRPTQPVLFDENGNIADTVPISRPSRLDEFNSRLENTDCRQRVRSMGSDIPCNKEKNNTKLQRSQSESIHKSSHSYWYDQLSDTKECDRAGPSGADIVDGIKYHTVIPTPRVKKGRNSSKFYVDVEEEDQSITDAASHPATSDKETSPLPLECSEKSVQTSLETLSHTASKGELSENSDDLLDLAQTLQDELKTIIKRHETERVESREGSSDRGSTPPVKKLSVKQRIPISSTSSNSELWQISSSDESEDEHSEAHLSEMSRTKKRNKIFYIAQEIMTSEAVFVDALKLLNIDFRTFVEEASKQRNNSVVPDDVLNQLLNHLPQLQHLNDNLLMELKDRIEHWDRLNKIADVIVKMGPFLKLYSWYIQDFEATMSLLDESKRKFPTFAQVVKEFEASPKCKRLTLNHYMLKPVQRIPQYRLLLQEYLHRLPNDSPDFDDTVEALRIVSDVANHANESMKQGDNFQKLMSIQSSILGHKEIIKPGRIFIKEGELMKLSRRDMQSRWFVLLNDLLLYLTPVQQGLYRVNHELELVGMKVAIPIQEDYQNEFSIISVTRSFTLAAKSPEERQEWIVALTKAIEENVSKRSTFTAVRLQQQSHQMVEKADEEGFILGKKAPVWIPDARVTMCQLCTSEFTVTFRRHHCRACGKVCCSICSSNRISLQYLGNRIARVCDECYTKLGQGSSGCTESGETDSDNQQIALKSHLRTDRHGKKLKRQLPSVLKEVCANDQGSTLSGYIHKRINKSWKRNWFVIKEKVLYEYRASEDVAALRSVPLLGFQINTFSEPYDGFDPSLVFEIFHPGQSPTIFRAETASSAERWIKELRESTVLE